MQVKVSNLQRRYDGLYDKIEKIRRRNVYEQQILVQRHGILSNLATFF